MKTPPKSSLGTKSDTLFKSEIWARVLTMVGLWVAAVFLLLNSSNIFGLDREIDPTLDLVIVIATLLFSLIADQILTAEFGRRSRAGVSESHDLIMSAIEGSSQVQTFSNQSAFENHILNRVSSAIEVRNTFVSYKTANGNPNAKDPANLECYRRFFHSEKRITGPRRWVDIVSYNEFFGPRYEDLKDILKGNTSSVRHVVRVIRHNIPMLNFTIFYFDSFSDEREVVFGWLHSDVVQNRRLFRSNDPAIIDMFEDFFNLISQYRLQEDVELKYNEPNIRLDSQLSDRQGWWYCVGLLDGQKIVSESIFQISFLEHGAQLDGEVRWLDEYGRQQKGSEIISHKSDKVSYTSSKMFLEYKEPDYGRRGICVYNFGTSRQGATLLGYLQDANSDVRVQLHGIRINGEKTSIPLSEEMFEGAREEAAASAHLRSIIKGLL